MQDVLVSHEPAERLDELSEDLHPDRRGAFHPIGSSSLRAA